MGSFGLGRWKVSETDGCTTVRLCSVLLCVHWLVVRVVDFIYRLLFFFNHKLKKKIVVCNRCPVNVSPPEEYLMLISPL